MDRAMTEAVRADPRSREEKPAVLGVGLSREEWRRRR